MKWRIPRVRFGLKSLFAITTLAALIAYYWSGHMPGTLRKTDSFGYYYWGTGTLRYYYPSGGLRCRHKIVAGQRRKSEWYLPDGSLFQEVKPEPGVPSTFYVLRDDGSVSDEFEIDGFVPDGRWNHFDESGNVDRIDTLLRGIVIERDKVKTVEK